MQPSPVGHEQVCPPAKRSRVETENDEAVSRSDQPLNHRKRPRQAFTDLTNRAPEVHSNACRSIFRSPSIKSLTLTEAEAPSFNDLPWCLVKNILSRIHTYSDVCSVILVCKGWMRLYRTLILPPLPNYDDNQRRNELKRIVPPNSMIISPLQVTSCMRATLVDWLVEVCLEFGFFPETLFLCISLVDRFLAKRIVVRSQFQLLGITCLHIAAKYEEVYARPIEHLIYVCDRLYSREDILKYELEILVALDFEITTYTSVHFLKKFLCSVSDFRDYKQLTHLSMYFAEITLSDTTFLNFFPSLTAAACMSLAFSTLKHPPWTEELEKLTRFSLRDRSLKACISLIHTICSNSCARGLETIKRKYSTPALLTPFPSSSNWIPFQ